MRKLTPAMETLVRALDTYGNVDPARDLGRMGLRTTARVTTGTITGLIARGILREWDHKARVFWPATRPEEVHVDALLENVRRERKGRFGHMRDDTWENFIVALEKGLRAYSVH